MEEGVTRRELSQMLERLLADVEAHASDYHHVTPPRLLAEARQLALRWRAQEAQEGP